MLNCNHEQTKTVKIKRMFRDLVFKTEGEVCLSCGAQLWTDKMYAAFKMWVASQENVRVQFKISDIASECLERLVSEVPKSKPITLAKILILVFSSLVKSGKGEEILNRAYDSDQFVAFDENLNSGKNFGFDVYPLFFLDIESLAVLYNQKTNDMASEAFHVMLAIFFSNDEVLKKYWKEEIYPKLQEFLKVA